MNLCPSPVLSLLHDQAILLEHVRQASKNPSWKGNQQLYPTLPIPSNLVPNVQREWDQPASTANISSQGLRQKVSWLLMFTQTDEQRELLATKPRLRPASKFIAIVAISELPSGLWVCWRIFLLILLRMFNFSSPWPYPLFLLVVKLPRTKTVSGLSILRLPLPSRPSPQTTTRPRAWCSGVWSQIACISGLSVRLQPPGQMIGERHLPPSSSKELAFVTCCALAGGVDAWPQQVPCMKPVHFPCAISANVQAASGPTSANAKTTLSPLLRRQEWQECSFAGVAVSSLHATPYRWLATRRKRFSLLDVAVKEFPRRGCKDFL